jgi:GNAT superfamily N-acetyltransferase
MEIEIIQESTTALAEYARIPIAFEVRRILELEVLSQGLDGLVLSERWLDVPYVKDYDALRPNAPEQWAKRFDLSSWGLFGARAEDRRVGGAAVALEADLDILEGRNDVAVLWDIRVSLESRGLGVGFALFQAVEAWATERGCRQLKTETQNVNVPACRFYARQGCVLGGIRRFAYPELPHEVQLLWYKQLQ